MPQPSHLEQITLVDEGIIIVNTQFARVGIADVLDRIAIKTPNI